MDEGGLRELCAKYLAAALVGDQRLAIRLLTEEGLAQGHTPAQLRREVVARAQAEVGRRWEQNALSVADEHQATAVSQVALAVLYGASVPKTTRKTRVVVACVEGEQHDLPARLAADALDAEGFSVHFLGASVPTESLLRRLATEPADLLVLSVTLPGNMAALEPLLHRLRALAPGPHVLVGGSGAAARGAQLEALGLEVLPADADALVARAKALFAGGQP